MGGRRLIVVLEGASLETVKVMWDKEVQNSCVDRMGPLVMRARGLKWIEKPGR